MSLPSKTNFFSEALAYDDVLLVPRYSAILPKDVSTKTQLSKNITLNIPFLSAAMDTVTESEMAISMALEGGIGFIHKNMNIEDQVAHVRKVKRYQSGLILDPITLQKEATIGEANSIMRNNKIGGIPIIDQKKLLVGIITNRDLRFLSDMSKLVKDVMTKDKLVTVNEGVNLTSAQEILKKHKIEKLPILNSKGELTGLITYKDILKKQSSPRSSKDKFGRLRAGAAVGITSDLMIRVEKLNSVGVDVISIDTAHAHSKRVIEACKEVKKQFPLLDIIVGNIVTGQAAHALVDAGADAVKVGVGPGSICTTRIIAGVGMPQFSAIVEVSNALKDTGIPIIADGGIRFSGDVVKAMAGGANSVMIGSLLAGTEEAPGEIIILEGRKYKSYRGMGSVEAMEEGSKDRYFQENEEDTKKLVPEGIVGRVSYKGVVSEILFQLVGGLKAGMGYCGSPDLDELKNSTFVKVTHAGVVESHPHDITITRESSNYSR